MTPQERAAEIARGLREGPRAVLMFLSAWSHERGGALSAPEIGLVMQGRGWIRKSSPGEWARPKLNRLRTDGLAKELGWSGNARTWVLTDLGCEVAAILSKQQR